jgi:hypothetical protein
LFGGAIPFKRRCSMRNRLTVMVGVVLLLACTAVLPFGCGRPGQDGGVPTAAAAGEGADTGPPGVKKGVKVEVWWPDDGPTIEVLEVRGQWVRGKTQLGEYWFNFGTCHKYSIVP